MPSRRLDQDRLAGLELGGVEQDVLDVPSGTRRVAAAISRPPGGNRKQAARHIHYDRGPSRRMEAHDPDDVAAKVVASLTAVAQSPHVYAP